MQVVDVYDLAASIGNDFEKLIDNYGNECVRGIMPKVFIEEKIRIKLKVKRNVTLKFRKRHTQKYQKIVEKIKIKIPSKLKDNLNNLLTVNSIFFSQKSGKIVLKKFKNQFSRCEESFKILNYKKKKRILSKN